MQRVKFECGELNGEPVNVVERMVGTELCRIEAGTPLITTDRTTIEALQGIDGLNLVELDPHPQPKRTHADLDAHAAAIDHTWSREDLKVDEKAAELAALSGADDEPSSGEPE